ncbi:MAG TPA: sulfite--cytochrome C oxidoreductase subunit B [Dongiaceae bacterium]|nr:sulfite--cytochrome C oxidoreductase subunit B [Dongiaceae bacterium]
MTKRTTIFALACAAAFGATALAAPKTAPPRGKATISLPGDAGMAFKPGAGVGAAQANCLTCHSSAYVSTQPVLSKAQWTAEVTKMKNVYGAPIPDDAVPAIVDYLTAQYGKP